MMKKKKRPLGREVGKNTGAKSSDGTGERVKVGIRVREHDVARFGEGLILRNFRRLRRLRRLRTDDARSSGRAQFSRQMAQTNGMRLSGRRSSPANSVRGGMIN